MTNPEKLKAKIEAIALKATTKMEKLLHKLNEALAESGRSKKVPAKKVAAKKTAARKVAVKKAPARKPGKAKVKTKA